MSRNDGYEKSLRLFEELDGLEDALVEEALLPEEVSVTAADRGGEASPADPAPRRTTRRLATWRRCAAVLCGVLTLTLALLLLRDGKNVSADGENADCAPGLPNYGEPDYEAPADPNYKGDEPAEDEVPEECPPAETED